MAQSQNEGLENSNEKTAIVIAALAAFGLCAPVFAEDAKTGLVPMTEVELDQAVAGSNGIIGPILSGRLEPFLPGVQTIYGNTTNPRPSGHGVTPSLSPGPWKCAVPADCSQGAVAGGSIGEFIAPFASDGKGSPDFANGTTTVKDNFGQPYAHGGVGP